MTKDTVSVLENEFAKSAAPVSDGLLAHSLETKPVQRPVEVQTKIVYRDWSSDVCSSDLLKIDLTAACADVLTPPP